MLLQGPEALKSLSLVSHMSQKLLKGKQVADESFDGQGLDELLPELGSQASALG